MTPSLTGETGDDPGPIAAGELDPGPIAAGELELHCGLQVLSRNSVTAQAPESETLIRVAESESQAGHSETQNKPARDRPQANYRVLR